MRDCVASFTIGSTSVGPISTSTAEEFPISFATALFSFLYHLATYEASQLESLVCVCVCVCEFLTSFATAGEGCTGGDALVSSRIMVYVTVCVCVWGGGGGGGGRARDVFNSHDPNRW